MARIPGAELERLKEEISVVRLLESAGVELRAHGADRIGRCRSTTTERRRWS